MHNHHHLAIFLDRLVIIKTTPKFINFEYFNILIENTFKEANLPIF